MAEKFFWKKSFIAHIWLSIIIFKIEWSTSNASTTNATDHEWRYFGNKGPNHWPEIIHKHCSGRKQSPIRLDNTTSIHDDSLSHYIFEVPDDHHEAEPYYVYNDGYKIGVHINDHDFKIGLFKTPEICLRPHGLHFHWGSKNNVGSEHWLNDRQYAMEGHLVTWDCSSYSDFETAFNGIDGLTVFGFFYDVVEGAPVDNYLKNIIDTFEDPHIKQCNDCYTSIRHFYEKNITAFDISQILPDNVQDYWRYSGSLTTPDCRENVDWIIFNTPKLIPLKQIEAFRKLEFPPVDGVSRAMVNNFRNIMQLNPRNPPGAWRQVTRSFKAWQDDKMSPRVPKVEDERISLPKNLVKSGEKTCIRNKYILATTLLVAANLF